jgi:hypothetical protein
MDADDEFGGMLAGPEKAFRAPGVPGDQQWSRQNGAFIVAAPQLASAGTRHG